jgi:AcrR family transcriptional regulator
VIPIIPRWPTNLYRPIHDRETGGQGHRVAGRKQFDVDDALDRAMTLFWQRGYAESSLDALCTATGLGRGSLYGTFRGKDELFRQALDRYGARYGDRYDTALDTHSGNPAAAVTAFLDVTVERISDPTVPNGCLIAQSAIESDTLSAASATRVRELVDRQRSRIRTALGEPPGASDGELDDLTSFVVAINQSLAVMSRVSAPEAELRAIARLAAGTVATSLGRDPGAHASRAG